MRVLVIGASGQVGSSLCHQISRRWDLVTADFLADFDYQIDLSQSESIESCLDQARPDLIINAAAYTAVDKAESEPELAMKVNAHGPKQIARWASKLDIPVIHYSTEYVFSGAGKHAWRENDPADPQSAYGLSKYLGECAVLEEGGAHVVLRTSWVFSSVGHNFVKTMLRLGHEREELRVVDDQLGAPTSADFLARCTVALFDRSDYRDFLQRHKGIYHLCCAGTTSWHGFAEAIFAAARQRGLPLKLNTLHAIPSSEYPTPARRPLNSRLDCSKFFSLVPECHQQPWQDALYEVMDQLGSK